MTDSRYNTLLLIEGEEYEKRFFDKFKELIKTDKKILIVPFCNDIYELYKTIKDLGETTIVDALIEGNPRLSKQEIENLRKQKFVYKYLIFDLELHNASENEFKENLGKAKEMLNIFDNETGDYGKLFINYPMMESYRHFKFKDDSTLKGKFVLANWDDLKNYKRRVGEEGTNLNTSEYNLNTYFLIAKAHVKQANLLLHNTFVRPTKNELFEILDIKKIHQAQIKLFEDKNRILVLNTSTFIYSEFYPQFISGNW